MKRLLVLFLLPALFLPAGAQAILPTVVPEPVSFEISSTDYVPLDKVSAAWNNASSFALRGAVDGYASSPLHNLVQTHLRQIGWDMHLSDPKQTGIYYYDIPPEPPLNI